MRKILLYVFWAVCQSARLSFWPQLRLAGSAPCVVPNRAFLLLGVRRLRLVQRTLNSLASRSINHLLSKILYVPIGESSSGDEYRSLTLPTSKEGGFLLQRSPPGREPGLTQSPQAYRFGCVPPYQLISYDSKRRPSFRMFFAAFKSTSWIAPQQGHSQCSLKRLLNALFRYPQTLQTCVLGNKASICTFCTNQKPFHRITPHISQAE